ncbi:MAG: DUF3365 domain-containing protein [Deltaproteobacteria bacterium]|nr:DUF3365 domain-containing protein [Deltaproteobacteria bacterium]
MTLLKVVMAVLSALVLPVLLLPVLATAAAPPPLPAPGDDLENSKRALERGSEKLKPFKVQLQNALQVGLADGPDAAIEVCKLRAPRIAAESSSSEVRVGRTSHKLRNPANAPSSWLKPLLARYLANPDQRDPEAVALEGGGVGYVEPIFVQSKCLVCHGEEIAEPLLTRIEELYPEDRATGFRVGDLRGLFWVEFEDAP